MKELKRNNRIYLNDILKLDDIDNIKIRFNIMFNDNWNPIEIYKNADFKTILGGHYHNYNNKAYKVGQTTIGFIRINKNEDLWLLFHIGKITKDLNKLNTSMAYEFEVIPEYTKYFGRLIVKFKNRDQTMIRLAKSVINDCEVFQILPEAFNHDIFPGYDKVDISWEELSRIIKNESWKTALQNQKGVYLITDSSTGKMYVGSAYGEDMILGRWKSYIKTCHGGNQELKKLDTTLIKKYFRYSILDIFKSTTDDNTIIERESWWKTVLQTRKYGYNDN